MNKLVPSVLLVAGAAGWAAFSCSTDSKKKKKGDDTVTATLPSPSPNPGVVITPIGPENPSPAQCTAACSDSLKIAFTAGTQTGARYWVNDEKLDEGGTQIFSESLDIPLARDDKSVEISVTSPKLRVRLVLSELEKQSHVVCGETCNRYEITLPNATRGWYYCGSHEGGDQKSEADLCASVSTMCPGGRVDKTYYESNNDGPLSTVRVFWRCGS